MNGNGNFEDRLRTGLHDLAGSAEPPPTLATSVAGRLGPSGGATGFDRRRAALLAIAAAIVVVAATVVVLSGRGGSHNTVAVGVPSTTTTTSPGTTIAVLPIVTAPPVTATTTPATTPTTTNTTTTATTATTATNGTTTSTTRLTTPLTTAPRVCTVTDLQTTTGTDRAVYKSGDPVTITVRVTNISPTRCQIAHPYPQTFASTIKITGATGTVWAPAAAVAGIFITPQPKTLASGESYDWTTAMWNQHMCVAPCNTRGDGQGGLVSAGTYVAQPNDGLVPPSPAASTSFKVIVN